MVIDKEWKIKVENLRHNNYFKASCMMKINADTHQHRHKTISICNYAIFHMQEWRSTRKKEDNSRKEATRMSVRAVKNIPKEKLNLLH